MKRILIIDHLNMLLRGLYSGVYSSRDGGGVAVYLKLLQKMIRITNPDRIFICHDGKGGSQKRKQLFKEYKSGRNPLFINPNIDKQKDDELKNKIWITTRVVEYLNQLPIVQLMIDGVEADDLVAHICNDATFDDYQKVICSNDKDFLQLCNDKTIVYRPVKDEILNKKTVALVYGIHPINLALARAICGDTSDNLDGVKGIGLVTVAKRFPFLAEEKEYTLNDILLKCRENNGKIKIYKNILKDQKKIQLNYKLMQLKYRVVSSKAKKKINSEIKGAECILNKPIFDKLATEDGIDDINFDILFENMKKLVLENCKDRG